MCDDVVVDDALTLVDDLLSIRFVPDDLWGGTGADRHHYLHQVAGPRDELGGVRLQLDARLGTV